MAKGKLSRAKVRELQRAMNEFTRRKLRDVAPVQVDGKPGPATRRRIKAVRYYLGNVGRNVNGRVDAAGADALIWRLEHPNYLRKGDLRELDRRRRRRAWKRRRRQRRLAAHPPTSGVGTFDGRPVANWMVPYLRYARLNGWHGTLTSGWRDPAYSEHLCMLMCGRPSCPGTCAGKSSNHVGSAKPAGAIDVSDYATFARLMRQCPYSPRIFNALGVKDPVHFSASGR